MRISDWSSDVCSSDLFGVGEVAALAAPALGDQAAGAVDARRVKLHELHVLQRQAGAQHHGVAVAGLRVGAGAGEVDAPDRKSVVSGKSVSVRVGIGGGRIIKKKKSTENIHKQI